MKEAPPSRVIRSQSCDGKRRYETFVEARKVATRTGRIGNLGGEVPPGPYACRYCGGFHVGHAPRRRPMKITHRRDTKFWSDDE